MRRQLPFPLATPSIRLRLPQDRLPEEKLHALRAGLVLSVFMPSTMKQVILIL
jgi:hypothetical protein